MTSYSEVGAEDRDVAIFLATQLQTINVWRLPLKTWVARQEGKIIAALVLTCVDYPAVHLLIADPTSRPFMRAAKLWKLAALWMRSIDMPMVCAPIFATLHHFQSLARKLGFVHIGDSFDDNGNPIETIYAYYFKEPE